jgi:hypothetical protein
MVLRLQQMPTPLLPCTRACTCAVLSARCELVLDTVCHLLAWALRRALGICHSKVIDNGLRLLMITPLERM